MSTCGDWLSSPPHASLPAALSGQARGESSDSWSVAAYEAVGEAEIAMDGMQSRCAGSGCGVAKPAWCGSDVVVELCVFVLCVAGWADHFPGERGLFTELARFKQRPPELSESAMQSLSSLPRSRRATCGCKAAQECGCGGKLHPAPRVWWHPDHTPSRILTLLVNRDARLKLFKDTDDQGSHVAVPGRLARARGQCGARQVRSGPIRTAGTARAGACRGTMRTSSACWSSGCRLGDDLDPGASSAEEAGASNKRLRRGRLGWRVRCEGETRAMTMPTMRDGWEPNGRHVQCARHEWDDTALEAARVGDAPIEYDAPWTTKTSCTRQNHLSLSIGRGWRDGSDGKLGNRLDAMPRCNPMRSWRQYGEWSVGTLLCDGRSSRARRR